MHDPSKIPKSSPDALQNTATINGTTSVPNSNDPQELSKNSSRSTSAKRVGDFTKTSTNGKKSQISLSFNASAWKSKSSVTSRSMSGKLPPLSVANRPNLANTRRTTGDINVPTKMQGRNRSVGPNFTNSTVKVDQTGSRKQEISGPKQLRPRDHSFTRLSNLQRETVASANRRDAALQIRQRMEMKKCTAAPVGKPILSGTKPANNVARNKSGTRPVNIADGRKPLSAGSNWLNQQQQPIACKLACTKPPAPRTARSPNKVQMHPRNDITTSAQKIALLAKNPLTGRPTTICADSTVISQQRKQLTKIESILKEDVILSAYASNNTHVLKPERTDVQKPLALTEISKSQLDTSSDGSDYSEVSANKEVTVKETKEDKVFKDESLNGCSSQDDKDSVAADEIQHYSTDETSTVVGSTEVWTQQHTDESSDFAVVSTDNAPSFGGAAGQDNFSSNVEKANDERISQAASYDNGFYKSILKPSSLDENEEDELSDSPSHSTVIKVVFENGNEMQHDHHSSSFNEPSKELSTDGLADNRSENEMSENESLARQYEPVDSTTENVVCSAGADEPIHEDSVCTPQCSEPTYEQHVEPTIDDYHRHIISSSKRLEIEPEQYAEDYSSVCTELKIESDCENKSDRPTFENYDAQTDVERQHQDMEKLGEESIETHAQITEEALLEPKKRLEGIEYIIGEHQVNHRNERFDDSQSEINVRLKDIVTSLAKLCTEAIHEAVLNENSENNAFTSLIPESDEQKCQHVSVQAMCTEAIHEAALNENSENNAFTSLIPESDEHDVSVVEQAMSDDKSLFESFSVNNKDTEERCLHLSSKRLWPIDDADPDLIKKPDYELHVQPTQINDEESASSGFDIVIGATTTHESDSSSLSGIETIMKQVCEYISDKTDTTSEHTVIDASEHLFVCAPNDFCLSQDENNSDFAQSAVASQLPEDELLSSVNSIEEKEEVSKSPKPTDDISEACSEFDYTSSQSCKEACEQGDSDLKLPPFKEMEQKDQLHLVLNDILDNVDVVFAAGDSLIASNRSISNISSILKSSTGLLHQRMTESVGSLMEKKVFGKYQQH